MDEGSIDAKSEISAYVSSLARNDIHIIDAPKKLSLGELRNLSRHSARGDVLCQWDDDDLHHPERLEQQLNALIGFGGQAVLLEEVMQYFVRSRTLYCINWRATEAKGLPGTLMCTRSAQIRYPETGPESRRGEDLAVSLQLQQQQGLYVLTGAPHLYVYVSHGDNSWPDDHHRMLASELSTSQGLLRRRETQLREGLACFDFGPEEVTIQGFNGPAFTLRRSS